MSSYTSKHTGITYTHCTLSYGTREETRHDLGAVDKKGRAIGARVSTFTLTRTEVDRAETESGYLCSPEQAGKTMFVYNTDATRNGVRYGSGGRNQEFATEAERAAGIAKFLKGAKARAAKAAK